MKIAILSDVHDNIWNLKKALDELKGQVDAVIFCGDYCAPFIPPKIAKLKVHVYSCLGNNDEDQICQLQTGGELFSWTPLADEFGKVELDGKKIAFCHYPKLAELLAKSEAYDAVFHGHTHSSRNEKHGKTLLLNPGAVCGIQNGKEGKASFAIYDTKTNSAVITEIK